jgi:hypothetical protein
MACPSLRTPLCRRLAALALLVVLSGCARIEGAMAPLGAAAPVDPAALDGRYAGNALYAEGPERCARRFGLALRVANGRVEGEIAPAQAGRHPPVRFEGFLEMDGDFAARMRAFGEILVLRGRFRDTRFDGRLEPEAAIDPRRNNPREGETNLRFGIGSGDCVWMLRAPRLAETAAPR